MSKDTSWHTYLDSNTVEIITLVDKFFKGDHGKTALWMSTDNLNFGGTSPNKLIKMNRGHKVLQFIKTALDEDYATIIKEGGHEQKNKG